MMFDIYFRPIISPVSIFDTNYFLDSVLTFTMAPAADIEYV